jgi:hypothetical protein
LRCRIDLHEQAPRAAGMAGARSAGAYADGRLNVDGRIAAHKLPPCRRENYLAKVWKYRLAYDRLMQAL